MKDISTLTFAELVQNFFTKRLVQQRNLSACTIASYRDTFKVLLRYLHNTCGKQPSQVALEDLTPAMMEAFLGYLESDRNNSIRTRNNRFAAIRSFLLYAAAQEPRCLSTVQRVLAIPMKRFDRPQMECLERDEIDAIIEAADCTTWSGRRDLAMFTTLYNTGARVSELIAVTVADVCLDACAFVRLHGKGRKERTVPLWRDTVRQLKRWIREMNGSDCSPLFPNVSGGHLSRSGVEYRLNRLVAIASTACPSLQGRRISPHTVRHTTAMHLLANDNYTSLVTTIRLPH